MKNKATGPCNPEYFPKMLQVLELHEKLGFRKIGFSERIGQLHGIWKDNILMEKRSKKIG